MCDEFFCLSIICSNPTKYNRLYLVLAVKHFGEYVLRKQTPMFERSPSDGLAIAVHKDERGCLRRNNLATTLYVLCNTTK